jgi:hypothetical protein
MSVKLIAPFSLFCGFVSAAFAGGSALSLPQLAQDSSVSPVGPTYWTEISVGKNLRRGIDAIDGIPSFFRYGSHNGFVEDNTLSKSGHNISGLTPYAAPTLFLDKTRTGPTAARANAFSGLFREPPKTTEVSSIRLGAGNGGKKAGFVFRSVTPGGYGPKASPTSGIGLFNR